MNEDNISKLIESKEKFMRYAKKIKQKFDGPSAYFYTKVINEVRSKDYSVLFDDEKFIEYLYATLASWGMQRMDKNTRMADFNDFKNSIINSKDLFIKLSGKEMQNSDISILKNDILNLFDSLQVMNRADAPKFVANSKIMHFLLPDLIPPLDNGNNLYFFYGWKSKNKKGKLVKRNPTIKDKEDGYFWDILNEYRKIAIKLSLSKDDLKNEWDTSIPKIIDNAIIGFNMEQELNR